MALKRTAAGLSRLKESARAVPCLLICSFYRLKYSNKIRQDPNVKGIKIYENEIKLSQFVDDTTLFNTDLASLERALKITNEFGKIAGLCLNVKQAKTV